MGVTVGTRDVNFVGVEDGYLVGDLVGEDGIFVGYEDGLLDGTAVGNLVGYGMVGDTVGA